MCDKYFDVDRRLVHVRTSDNKLITSYSCGTVRRLLTPYVTEG